MAKNPSQRQDIHEPMILKPQPLLPWFAKLFFSPFAPPTLFLGFEIWSENLEKQKK